ncbi:MAG: hypothetical protein LQ344_003345 [Seirophora lacunosa]|nr:MAG: hypothetical protein LQ344_003345 [Seirophora lacunosa]
MVPASSPVRILSPPIASCPAPHNRTSTSYGTAQSHSRKTSSPWHREAIRRLPDRHRSSIATNDPACSTKQHYHYIRSRLDNIYLNHCRYHDLCVYNYQVHPVLDSCRYRWFIDVLLHLLDYQLLCHHHHSRQHWLRRHSPDSNTWVWSIGRLWLVRLRVLANLRTSSLPTSRDHNSHSNHLPARSFRARICWPQRERRRTVTRFGIKHWVRPSRVKQRSRLIRLARWIRLVERFRIKQRTIIGRWVASSPSPRPQRQWRSRALSPQQWDRPPSSHSHGRTDGYNTEAECNGGLSLVTRVSVELSPFGKP